MLRLAMLGFALLFALPASATLYTSCSYYNAEYPEGRGGPRVVIRSGETSGDPACSIEGVYMNASYGILYGSAPADTFPTSEYGGTAIGSFSQLATITGRPSGTPVVLRFYCAARLGFVTPNPDCEDPFNPTGPLRGEDVSFQFGVPFEIAAAMRLVGPDNGGIGFDSFSLYRMDVLGVSGELLHSFSSDCQFTDCFTTFMQQAPAATYVVPGDPLATPEPGTASLALGALLVVGVMRLRRA
jgi:hypothetical protein